VSAAPPDQQQEQPDRRQLPPDQGEELIHHLERDQLVAETLRPVQRARISHRVTISLWALRIFAVALGVMVIYTFIARL
jgi:hypothetical protein